MLGGRGDASAGPGRAVQVDPIKLTLRPPGTGRLTLKYDKLLSSFAFNFNLRRFNPAQPPRRERRYGLTDIAPKPKP